MLIYARIRAAQGPLAVAVLLAVALAMPAATRAAAEPPAFELHDGDRVVLLGDSFVENERQFGWIELMLTTRFADRSVSFRNLGWSADTPAGASRLGLSQFAAGKEPPDEGWKELVRHLTENRPTVVLLGYGMASSFAGDGGLADFEAEYLRLLGAIGEIDSRIRCVLVGPVPHEALGPPWPDPAARNAELRRYDDVIRAIASRKELPFVSLFEALARSGVRPTTASVTHNGIHLSEAGYRRAAEVLEEHLFGGAGAWRTSSRTEVLREAIVRKNAWFHHRWRPHNFVYSFGFLKGHQGEEFRSEILSFDDYVAAEEARIARLRSLEPGDVLPPPTLSDGPPARPAEPRSSGGAPARTTYGLVIPQDVPTLPHQPEPRFEVAEGLEVTLWAKNPLLRNPIQMNFDSEGRLWVATSDVYPHLAPGQKVGDRIILLEDTTGRGRADKATVFADDLLIPTSVEPGDGGVYVTHTSELLHLRDTDGDGRADERRVLLRGFGTEDGHQVVHGLRWGPDGRLYLNQSVYTRSHLETPHGIVRHHAGGIFRFDPRNQRLEVRYRGWVNPWGHQFDNYGQSFVTDGADHHGINWGVPGATFNTLAPARRILQSVSAGVYPKFIGIEIVRSRHFPDDWQGDVITCDFRAHTVVRFKLAEQGTAFATREMPPVLRSTDQHFRPLDVKLGPDGALYLADWSNPIIQHSGVDFREPRRDREHGRIWRIAAKGRAALPVVRFGSRPNRELFDALKSANSYDRERARRVLLERGFEAVAGDLSAWQQDHPDDESRLQAAWLRQGFNQPDPALLRDLLRAADGRIRAAAVRALPVEAALDQLRPLVADSHPRVRLEAVRALGQYGSVPALDLALSVLNAPMDPFLDYALWLTVNELVEPWRNAVQSGQWLPTGRDRQVGFVLSSVEPAIAGEVMGRLLGAGGIPEESSWIELIGRSGPAAELERLYGQVLQGGFSAAGRVRALAALGEAARLRRAFPTAPRGDLETLFGAGDSAVRLAALKLAGEWQAADLAPALLNLAGDERTGEMERTAAFGALRAIGGDTVTSGLRRLLRTLPHNRIRAEAVVAFAAVDLAAALPDVLELLRVTREPGASQALWRELLVIRDAGSKIAEALPPVGLPAAVALAGLRPAREGHRHPALVDVLQKSAGRAFAAGKLAPAELRALAQEAVTKGDASRGERIYRRAELACVACHAIGGAGGRVGPDLTSIGTSAPPDYLLESMLEPNAQIKQGYHAVLIGTRDRRQLSGTIVRETADEIILRDAAGGESAIAVRDIEQRTSVGSLMPAGLIDTLLPEELWDLIKFLSVLGKPGEYDATQGGVARLWRIYAVVSRLQLIPTERIVGGDFTLPDWMSVHALANGALPRESLEAYIPLRGAPIRGLYAASQFHSALGGPATFRLSAEAKGLWLNGTPIKPARQFTVETKPGMNVIVVQVSELDRADLPEAMKLSSEDVTFLLQ